MKDTFKTWNDIPADLRKAVRWSGGLHSHGDREPLRFSCAAWSFENGILRLTGALLDTSHRFGGVTLEPSITYHAEAYFGGIVFHFHPLTTSDLARPMEAA